MSFLRGLAEKGEAFLSQVSQRAREGIAEPSGEYPKGSHVCEACFTFLAKLSV